MISTHILDLNLGLPASGVVVELKKKSGSEWPVIQEATTNSDGRIQFNVVPDLGTYKLNFKIEDYFIRLKQVPFFVTAPVIFQVSDVKRKYHIPLLLSTYGYSTYRGS